MKSIIQKVYRIFPSKLFHSLIVLYFLLLVLTIFEFIGIGSIPIMISMMIDYNTEITFLGLDLSNIIKKLSPFENRVIFFGLIIIFIFFLKAIFLLFFNLFELTLRKKMKISICQKLMNSYLSRPFIFFINNNSSDLSKNIITEVDQSVTFINSILSISKEISIVMALFLVMFYFEPILAISVFIVITVLVAFFLYSTDSKLKKIAQQRWNTLSGVFKSAGNIFSGIKDIKVFKKEELFAKEFLELKKNYENALQISEFIRRLPKTILEFFAIIFLVSLTIIFIELGKNTLELIPILSLIAVTVIRFIPSFNTIAAEITYLKVYKLAFDNVSKEILENKNFFSKIQREFSNLSENNAVEIENLNFNYLDQENKIPGLKNLNLKIKKNSFSGIVGKSGAGKSTIINIILGLLDPQSGSVKIDKSLKKNDNTVMISYVPQDIILNDDTLKSNIAFGVAKKEIDEQKVLTSLKDAGLSDFLENKDINLNVGDKGIKLSGGERQRIGIARALYVNPKILVLDEPTSALDIETESEVIKTINKLKSKCTVIIIAHKISTLKHCDNIFLIDKGNLMTEGSFEKMFKIFSNSNNYENK